MTAPPVAALAAARLRERLAAVLAAVAPDRAERVAGKPRDVSLHDLRVACRRLETALRLWAQGNAAREARVRARAMRRAAGPAREHEVLIGMLRARRLGAAAVPPPLRRAWLERLSRAPHASPQVALPAARALAKLAARVERVACDLAAEPDTHARMRAKLQRWRLAGRSRLAQALASGDTETLHRARLALKRWRYAEEERAAAWPGRSRAGAASPLRRWQRSLGELNDRSLLIAFAAAVGPPGRRLVARLEALRSAQLRSLRARRDALVVPPRARSRRA